jgi:hypothetical protein
MKYDDTYDVTESGDVVNVVSQRRERRTTEGGVAPEETRDESCPQ